MNTTPSTATLLLFRTLLLLSYPYCVYDSNVIQADHNNPNLDPGWKALRRNWIQLLHKWNTFLLQGALWEQQEIGNMTLGCSFLAHTCVSLRLSLSFFWQSREPINMLLLIGPVWEQCRPLLSRKLKKKCWKVASGKFQQFLSLMKAEIQAMSPAVLYSVSIPNQDWNTEASNN